MIATASNLIGEDQALSLIDSVIKQSESEGVFVSLTNKSESLTRFSENQISQNISSTKFNLNITSYFGKKSASSSTTDLDPDAIATTLRRSEELAKIAPEDPEWVPLLEPQNYEHRHPCFDEHTANLSPLERGKIVQRVCAMSSVAEADGSGTLSTETSLKAIGNSTGLRACDRGTEANFSFTARISDGSSWGNRTALAIHSLPIESLTEQLIDRAKKSQQPSEVSPGKYPVILDAPAFSSLLSWVIWNLDARAADEGRSFMSRSDENGKPNGNRLGESMFSPLIQVQRDPAHPLLQSGTFFGDGLPNNYLQIIHNGVPENLSYSRYWASQKGKTPTGVMFPFVMSGSDLNLANLIAQTERGVLVSRAWYVQFVNPRTLDVTGMTRDGTFWIENGKIAYPIKNFRFNQSLPEMLRNVDAIATVQRFGSSVVPAVRVKEFNFSSITESV